MKIWAHRGASLDYPENTLAAFSAAARLMGLAGIELDIQLTADNKLVVIHDETVDRTTNGKGWVKDYTLRELKKLRIKRSWWKSEKIPTLEEVLELLEKPMAKGLLLNIELKNNKIAYNGLEKFVAEMIRANNLWDKVVYSSFNAESLKKLREYEGESPMGILAGNASQCLACQNGGCPAGDIHPGWNGLDVAPEKLKGLNVRAFGPQPLFPEREAAPLDLGRLEAFGVTDVFVNNPASYL